jgi:hypothetical protein
MRLLVKNQKENEPEEPVGKVAIRNEEVQNRVETILLQERKKYTRSTKQRYL